MRKTTLAENVKSWTYQTALKKQHISDFFHIYLSRLSFENGYDQNHQFFLFLFHPVSKLTDSRNRAGTNSNFRKTDKPCDKFLFK